MASSLDNEDDSLIVILGTSPGASMNAEKCNGIANGELERSQIEDAMKSLSNEANMAFKAQFNLGDSPSPASMMVASTIITEDRSTEELQKRFGDLLDENFVLKETLKQNNDSMKEQFILIASCQEDMLKTHRLHQEKFDETRELVERLRQENKQLKLDITRLAEGEQASEQKKLSGFELVNSAEEDTIQKLSAQLELVEKQRRQLIVENEKLSWQKESLEHIVDSMNNDRDDARRKLHTAELQLSTRENDHAQEVSKLHCVISDLQNSIKDQSSNIPPEEVSKRDAYIQQLESKMASLQNELKKSQIKILDLENIKLEFSQYKSSVSDMVRTHKEQIQELNNRIKEVQTTVFQPARVSSSPSGPTENVRLYDRTLKHLADYLNSLTDGLADSLALALGAAAGALEARAERPGAERPGAERPGAERQRAALAALKDAIQTMHSHVVSNVGQVKGTLSIFEGIFKDHNELLKKTLTQTNTVARPALQRECGEGVQQLTAALLARGQQLSALQRELLEARAASDHAQLLQAQLDLYKSDFEAERESREKMASEKENLHSDLRIAQRKIQDMTTQLEELRVLSPSLHKSIISSRPRTVTKPYATTTTTATTATVPAASNAAFKCPKCMIFTSDQYNVMEDHFEYCLDDF